MNIRFWHNLKTGEIDMRDKPVETDEEAKQYIPQHSACQGLYDCYRLKGLSVSDAMIKVLEIVCKGASK